MGSEHKVGKEHDQRMKGWNIDAHTTSARCNHALHGNWFWVRY